MSLNHAKVLNKPDPSDSSIVGSTDWNSDHTITSPVSLKDTNFNEVAGIYFGTGTPEGTITAKKGSIYLNLNGGSSTTLYVKESGTGNTGWIGK